ncbi:unnamed protein product [Fusarium fujikuroi]|uniref:Uncharacterized protein n=1 Tax=Fusarium fujikuroi TaxID=5127 RepID=A0A9Q9RQK0_FUSFU|nr:unnamed protein product [Fusarium fujikuroi]
MNNLALILSNMEEWKLIEKVLGKEYLSTLNSISNLTLEAREKVLGKKHLDTLNSMNNLVLMLRKMAKYEEAEKMHRKTGMHEEAR